MTSANLVRGEDKKNPTPFTDLEHCALHYTAIPIDHLFIGNDPLPALELYLSSYNLSYVFTYFFLGTDGGTSA